MYIFGEMLYMVVCMRNYSYTIYIHRIKYFIR